MKDKILLALSVVIVACNGDSSGSSEILVAGTMREVMQQGKLEGQIRMDTLKKENLYGIGPVEFMKGEILILDGVSYVSTVMEDSTLSTTVTDRVAAPFFVYGYNSQWKEVTVTENISDIHNLEKMIGRYSEEYPRPFVFKITGKVKSALIHSQNLPDGTVVRSPEEAHGGQMEFSIRNTEAELIGFWSTTHKGIFTHHDSNMHIHLITADREKMGHLDDLQFEEEFTLYLPDETH